MLASKKLPKYHPPPRTFVNYCSTNVSLSLTLFLLLTIHNGNVYTSSNITLLFAYKPGIEINTVISRTHLSTSSEPKLYLPMLSHFLMFMFSSGI